MSVDIAGRKFKGPEEVAAFAERDIWGGKHKVEKAIRQKNKRLCIAYSGAAAGLLLNLLSNINSLSKAQKSYAVRAISLSRNNEGDRMNLFHAKLIRSCITSKLGRSATTAGIPS